MQTDNEMLAENNDNLAIFCGLELEGYPTHNGRWRWVGKKGEFFCWHDDWNPAKDWNHLRLVLEALVKLYTFDVEFYTDGSCSIQMWLWAKGDERGKEKYHKSFPQAIIDAAMEIIKSEGKIS